MEIIRQTEFLKMKIEKEIRLYILQKYTDQIKNIHLRHLFQKTNNKLQSQMKNVVNSNKK